MVCISGRLHDAAPCPLADATKYEWGASVATGSCTPRSTRRSHGPFRPVRFLLAWMSDVTHHPMSHITYVHNIPISNIIQRRNLKSLPIYNTKPIFATLIICVQFTKKIIYFFILFQWFYNVICHNSIPVI